MDKYQAFTEIEKVLYSKEFEHLTPSGTRLEIVDILGKMESYQYEWGRKNGVYHAINRLNEEVETMKIGNDE